MHRSALFSGFGLVAASLLASQPAWAGTIPMPEPGGLTLLALAGVGGYLVHRLRRRG